jgi:hypothetical protein
MPADQYDHRHSIRDQSLADHRPIASFPRLWCYRLITSDPIGRVHKEFFGMEATMTAIKKTPSVLGWYRILRVHYSFTLLQAVRYALWLAR